MQWIERTIRSQTGGFRKDSVSFFQLFQEVKIRTSLNGLLLHVGVKSKELLPTRLEEFVFVSEEAGCGYNLFLDFSALVKTASILLFQFGSLSK